MAILVWHIYRTVFNPAVYPMNPAWWSGRMPQNMYAHEHPEAAKLKGHDCVPREVEETEPEA